jgi:hypothetical protein
VDACVRQGGDPAACRNAVYAANRSVNVQLGPGKINGFRRAGTLDAEVALPVAVVCEALGLEAGVPAATVRARVPP